MNNLNYLWKQLNILYKLLAVNVAVFLIILLIKLISFLFAASSIADNIIRFFSLPADLLKILFKPWTIFTYMFLHQNFWHLFGNMLWLYFMGLLFVMFFGEKLLWRVYLLGGFFGGLLYVISFNLFPAFYGIKNFSVLLGASAAISAIVLAVAIYKPRQTIMLFAILPVPLWLIAGLYVIYDLSMLTVDNTGGHLSHIGGAIFGVWFAMKYKQGQDITKFLTKINFRRKPKMEVHINDFRPYDYDWNKKQKDIQKEIDRILDKISKKGYNSLTRKEKEFLKYHSRNYR